MPRVLNRFDAIAIVVGSIIGSGIFLKESVVASLLNSFVLSVAVWTIVGLINLCASLALAELAAMLPHAGGPYVYLRHAYGRGLAFLWGWTEFWIIRSGSVGALACATAIYINAVFPSIDRTGQEILAIAIVVVLASINAIGTRWGASVQNVTAVVKVGFLLTLIIAPWLLRRADATNLEPLLPPAADIGLLRALGLAMIAVSWPYDGWISIAPIAEEIRKPQRNVPIALCVGMLIVILVYVGAITSYHLVIPMQKVAQSSAIAADVCQVLFGNTGKMIAAIGVMFSTFGACNSNMLTGPRIYFSMARDGLLPRALRDVHSRFQTPANAILLQGFWAVLLIVGVFYGTSNNDRRSLSPTAAFDSLTDFVIFGGSLFYAFAVGAVFVLRRKYPTMERPYRTWGYPVTPLIYLVAFAALLANLLINKWFETGVGVVLIAAGAVYYVIATRRERASR